MPTAIIEINGVAGSRDDLTVSVTVNLSNGGDSGSTFLWEFLSKPPGSTATISGATTENSASFVPDIVGSYLIRLTIDGDTSGADVRVGAVNTTNLDIRIPAAGETTEFDNNPLSGVDGWHEALYNALTTVDTQVGISLKADGSVTPTTNIGWGGFRITNLGTPLVSSDAATLGSITLQQAYNGGRTVTGSLGEITLTVPDDEDGLVIQNTGNYTGGSNFSLLTVTGGGATEQATNAAYFDLDAFGRSRTTLYSRTSSTVDMAADRNAKAFYALVVPRAGDNTTSKYTAFQAQQVLAGAHGGTTVGFEVINSVAAGDTHIDIALRAESGDIHLLDGYLLLGEISDPTPVIDQGMLYTKNDGGDTELYYMDGAGNVVKLTQDGSAVGGGGSGSDGYNVKVSSDDTTPDFLENKLMAGENIEFTTFNGGADEELEVKTTQIIRLFQQAITPTQESSRGILYGQFSSGIVELFYIDNNGVITQLTENGTLAGGGSGTGGLVKVSPNDAYDGYLDEKIVAGLNISLFEINDSYNETFSIETNEVIQLPEQISDPTATGLDGYLYTKDVDGYIELFYMDGYGTPTQITSDGYLDTFESLRGVGLFLQDSDPTSSMDKGYLYTKINDGYTELFYRGDDESITPITRRGELVGFGGASWYEDSDELSTDTNISPVSTPTVGGGWVDNHLDSGLEISINTFENERVILSVSGWASDAAGGTGGNSIFYHFTVDDIPGVVHVQSVDANTSTTLSVQESRILTAGTHTVKLRIGGEAGEDITLREGLKLTVARVRGELTSRDSDTSLPKLTYVDASSIDVAATLSQVDSDRVRITLQDGKQRSFTGTLTFAFSNGVADLGLDTGTEVGDTWYYLYLVPDSSNDTKLTLRASISPPHLGPSGFANYRYLGAFRNDSSSDIRPFFHERERFFYQQRHTVIALGAADDASPVTLSLADWVPVGASSMETLLWVGGGTFNIFTEGVSSSFLLVSSDNNDLAAAAMPLTSTLQIEYQRSNSPVYANIYSQGWTDGYLSSANTHIPPAIAPDSVLPPLTYEDVASISVAAPPGAMSATIRQTLQDGKQRSFSGTLTFDFANGVADEGLDTGSEASDTWYYLYLVPKLTDDNQLTLRASTNPPYNGPSGYSNYRYIGAFRNDGSNDIKKFYQTSSHFFYDFAQVILDSSGDDASPVTLDINGFVPATSDAAELRLHVVAGQLLLFVKGNSTDTFGLVDDSSTGDIASFLIPTPGDSKEVLYDGNTSPANKLIHALGWIDGYLASTSGGSGGGGGGSTDLNGAYNEGNTITADSGPVIINASGSNALDIDGYLTLSEITDPSSAANEGHLYAKDDGYGNSELYYQNSLGDVINLTNDGYASPLSGENELDPAVTDGTETTIFLDNAPRSAASLKVYRNGVLMRRRASPSASPNDYTWDGDRTVTFAASLSAGDWYYANYLYEL